MTLRLNLVHLAWDPVAGSTNYEIQLDGVKVALAGPRAKTTKINIPAGAERRVTIKALPSGQVQEARFEWASLAVAPPPPPPPPPPTDLGSALPARFARPTGSVITVTNASEFTAALSSVNPGQIIQGQGTITGQFRCTRPGPYLIEPAPGSTFTIMGPATNPSQPLRIEPGVSNVMLHNFAIRGARGPSSQGLYLKDCSYVEVVGLDIHSDYHDLISPADTSGVMGIFSSAATHHCYGWYLHIWENGQNRTDYAPDHGWYMEGDDHWLIGSLVRDHWWGYGVHLYPIGHRRHVVNCTIVNSKRAGFITAGGTAVDDEVVNCISVDSPDQEYAYRFDSGSGHKLRHSLGWNPSTTKLTGTTGTAYTAMDPLLDSSHRARATLPLGDPDYTPPLYRDGTARTAATLGSEEPI